MNPEPLTGPALRSALAALRWRPVTEIEIVRPDSQEPATSTPRHRGTWSREAVVADIRVGLSIVAIAAKHGCGRGTAQRIANEAKANNSKGRPKFDHEAAMQRAREGATPAQLAQEFGVSDRSIYNLLSREWPDRPKLSKHDKGAAP